MVDIRYGQSDDTVKSLQSLLNSKGFNCGVPDGVFGTNTLDAVIAFQKAHGLTADGVVGTLTWNALNSIPSVQAKSPIVPSGTTFKGFDASNYQGTIDWQTVKASGIDFVYVKATEGLTFNDGEFQAYTSGAKSVGIPVGAYHFAHPESNSAKDEANHFLSIILNHDLELIPCLDLEEPNKRGNMTGSQIEAWANEWIDIVEKATGRQVLLYTGEWFINEYGLQNLANTHPLWISIYSMTKPSDNFVVWQYSDKGVVGGVKGNVDLDTCYSNNDFGILKGTTQFKGGNTMSNVTVQEGSSGGAVITLQTDLNKLGFNCGIADGIFGTNTKDQVIAFQKAHGLVSDGVCGDLTWAEMEKAIADKNSPKPVTPAPQPTPAPVVPVSPVVVSNPTSTSASPAPVTPVVSPTPVSANPPQKVSINNIDVVTHEEFNTEVAKLATNDALNAGLKNLAIGVDSKLQEYVKVTDLRELVLGIVTDAINMATKVNISN